MSQIFFHACLSSAYVPAAMIANLPVDTIKSIVFATIVYFLAGFVNELDRYLFFILMVWTVSLTMGQFARAAAALSPDISVAQSLAPITGIVFICFSG